jgi:hypothetical protein
MALKDAPRCSAKSKRTGSRCRNPACAGFKVCRSHGGRSRVGVAHPNFKHGRYSRHLPSHLAAKFKEVQEDSELIELHGDVVLIEAMKQEVMAKLYRGDTKNLWEALRKAHQHYEKARALGDVRQMNSCLCQIGDLIKTGATDYMHRSELLGLMKDKVYLVNAESKRLLQMGQMMTVEQAMVLVAAVTEAVKRHVVDPDTLSAIGNEFTQLMVIKD